MPGQPGHGDKTQPGPRPMGGSVPEDDVYDHANGRGLVMREQGRGAGAAMKRAGIETTGFDGAGVGPTPALRRRLGQCVYTLGVGVGTMPCRRAASAAASPLHPAALQYDERYRVGTQVRPRRSRFLKALAGRERRWPTGQVRVRIPRIVISPSTPS